MAGDARATYAPINSLKPVTDDVWIVDGPVIRFGPRPFSMPFSTRMTILRVANELFIHSPTVLTPSLKAALDAIGTPRWLIAPNRLHYWWIPEWHAAFPDAAVYLAPRIREQARGRIDFDSVALDHTGGYPWDAALATLPVTGRYMTEVVFFHRPSRTLVLTDLIENFEDDKIASPLMRLLTWFGGVRAPDGQMPRDMRLTFDRRQLKQAVETMLSWSPERVIIAHGRWFERNGTHELRRAFRWLLDRSARA